MITMDIVISNYHTGDEIERRKVSADVWARYMAEADAHTGAAEGQVFGLDGTVWATPLGRPLPGFSDCMMPEVSQ